METQGNDWAQWEYYNNSLTATMTVNQYGVRLIEKPNDDGSVNGRLYPRVLAGDDVLFTIEARLIDGDLEADTCPSIAIDYPETANPVVEVKIDSSSWKQYQLRYTVPFDAADGQKLPISAGVYGGRVGSVEFKNPRLRIQNGQSHQMHGIGIQAHNTLGRGFEAIPLKAFKGDEALLLGKWEDALFRMAGSMRAARTSNSNVGERFGGHDLMTTADAYGNDRSVIYSSFSAGYSEPGFFYRATYNGETYLVLANTSGDLWSDPSPRFWGYHQNLVNQVVSQADLTDLTPTEDLTYGYERNRFNGAPAYSGRNALDSISFDANGNPSGGIVESGKAGSGYYRITADGTGEAHINGLQIPLNDSPSGFVISLPIAFKEIHGLSVTTNSEVDLWDDRSDRFRFWPNGRGTTGSSIQTVIASAQGTSYLGKRGGINVTVVGVADV
jgi:hypothetical protein